MVLKIRRGSTAAALAAAVFSTCICAAPRPAAAQTGETLAPGDTVATLRLDNGMKILVQEDHSTPTVALYLFFRVGSRDERPGITGISHFFEHMMFNGSQRYGFGEFDRQMEQNGGENNAYTTKDTTVYTDWFPPHALELMMSMESDRMAHLTFDPKVVASERGVVYSERRSSVDNNDFGALFEQVNAAAIVAHPYHWPVIGWPSDIEAWTREDLEEYYRQGYAPNNCVMVAVGDVASKDVFALAHRYFDGIPSHPTFGEPPTKEPPQRGERVVTVRRQTELPSMLLAFHIPETRSPENPAIQVLEALLSSGQSSRLYARLVDKDQLALNVRAGDETSLDPYLLTIRVEPRAGVDLARVKAVLLEELDRVCAQPVPDGELRKAKNQWLAGHYRKLKTVAGRAGELGTYEVFEGSYRRLFEEPGAIEKVTAEGVRDVAAKIFTADNRTVGILEPVHASASDKRASGGAQ